MPVGSDLFDYCVEWCFGQPEHGWHHSLAMVLIDSSPPDVSYHFQGTLEFWQTRILGSTILPARFEGSGQSWNEGGWARGSAEVAIVLSHEIQVTASEVLADGSTRVSDWLFPDVDGYLSGPVPPDPFQTYIDLDLRNGDGRGSATLDVWPIRTRQTMIVGPSFPVLGP
jgi:hypothetical protein